MLSKTRCFTRKSTRRGSLTLELVLILPIIFLLVALIYQVSVMMMTHQAMQSAAMVGLKVAKRDGATVEQVEDAVYAALQGWYFAEEFKPNTSGLGKVRCMYKQNATPIDWRELPYTVSTSPSVVYNNPSDIPVKDYIGVQVEFYNMADKYKHYWLLNQFIGVTSNNNTTTNSVVATACGIKEGP